MKYRYRKKMPETTYKIRHLLILKLNLRLCLLYTKEYRLNIGSKIRNDEGSAMLYRVYNKAYRGKRV